MNLEPITKEGTSMDEILSDFTNVHYAFQPIIQVSTGEIFGYEGLMRPVPFTPDEVIYEYEVKNRLQYIETLTFFQAARAFLESGLEGKLFLNSFPCVSMTHQKADVFFEKYGKDLDGRLVVELLEYPEIVLNSWYTKRRYLSSMTQPVWIALDDFGTGVNIDSKVVSLYNPQIVKLDRSLISRIHQNERKQAELDQIISFMRPRGTMILAEGVETKEEHDYLVAQNLDFLQGFYIGMPTIYADDFSED